MTAVSNLFKVKENLLAQYLSCSRIGLRFLGEMIMHHKKGIAATLNAHGMVNNVVVLGL